MHQPATVQHHSELYCTYTRYHLGQLPARLAARPPQGLLAIPRQQMPVEQLPSHTSTVCTTVSTVRASHTCCIFNSVLLVHVTVHMTADPLKEWLMRGLDSVRQQASHQVYAQSDSFQIDLGLSHVWRYLYKTFWRHLPAETRLVHVQVGSCRTSVPHVLPAPLLHVLLVPCCWALAGSETWQAPPVIGIGGAHSGAWGQALLCRTPCS